MAGQRGAGQGTTHMGPPAHARRSEGGSPTETEVRQGEVTVCVQPGRSGAWGRDRAGATACRVEGKSGPGGIWVPGAH